MKGKWIEHLSDAFEAFTEELAELIPEETRKHLRNARKELLLALRTLIDKKIEKLEKPKKEVKKVEIEKE